MSRVPVVGRLAANALPRLLLLAALLLGAPVASRAVEARLGYVRWRAGPGTGLEPVGASRPPQVLLHLQGLGPPVPDAFDTCSACPAGDVDGDGHDDLWVLSALGPGPDVGGGLAALVSGRTGRVLRRMRQYDLRAGNLSVTNAGDVDADGVDDLLLGQMFRESTRMYWVRSGANGRLIQDVQRYRTNMLAPVVVHPVEGGRTLLGVGRTPRDLATPWGVDLVDPRTGAAAGASELPPAWGFSLTDLGDLDGDGPPERGGPGGAPDHLSVLSSTGRETELARSVPDGTYLRVEPAGDLDADGVPDVLVRATEAEELWVLSGASLVER